LLDPLALLGDQILLLAREISQESRNAHRFERMRLRGLSGARDEFHLAAIVQNLKRLATLM
jgi:hypothetical protein